MALITPRGTSDRLDTTEATVASLMVEYTVPDLIVCLGHLPRSSGGAGFYPMNG